VPPRTLVNGTLNFTKLPPEPESALGWNEKWQAAFKAGFRGHMAQHE
jgi:hypothetical protein